MDVRGMSLKDVMNVPRGTFLELDRSTQRVLASRLVSAANKRVRRLLKNGIDVTLSSYVKGGKFSIKGKQGKEFLKEINRMQEFLSRRTSTVRGYRAYRKMFGLPANYALEESFGMPGREPEPAPVPSAKDAEEVIDDGWDEEWEGTEEDFEGVRFGDDWQALDDLLENNRELLEESARYDLHDEILDYMNEHRISDVRDATEAQREEMERIIDRALQGRGSRVSFDGNP